MLTDRFVGRDTDGEHVNVEFLKESSPTERSTKTAIKVGQSVTFPPNEFYGREIDRLGTYYFYSFCEFEIGGREYHRGEKSYSVECLPEFEITHNGMPPLGYDGFALSGTTRFAEQKQMRIELLKSTVDERETVLFETIVYPELGDYTFRLDAAWKKITNTDIWHFVVEYPGDRWAFIIDESELYSGTVGCIYGGKIDRTEPRSIVIYQIYAYEISEDEQKSYDYLTEHFEQENLVMILAVRITVEEYNP